MQEHDSYSVCSTSRMERSGKDKDDEILVNKFLNGILI